MESFTWAIVIAGVAGYTVGFMGLERVGQHLSDAAKLGWGVATAVGAGFFIQMVSSWNRMRVQSQISGAQPPEADSPTLGEVIVYAVIFFGGLWLGAYFRKRQSGS